MWVITSFPWSVSTLVFWLPFVAISTRMGLSKTHPALRRISGGRRLEEDKVAASRDEAMQRVGHFKRMLVTLGSVEVGVATYLGSRVASGTAGQATVVENLGFLARMYARFLGGPAMQGSWFRCGISPGLARFTAVWSLNRPPAARAPLLGGGPARRQPLPPQGADATTLMSLRPVKVLESLGLIVLDGHCWPGASLSAKAPRNWLAAAFRPLPRPEVRAGLESLLRYETVEESLK